MITPIGMISIVVGIIVCFSGYSMFRSMLPLWGFILGGAAAMYLAPLVIKVPEAQRLWLDIGSFVVGGVLGAVLASPLYYVTIFASGAAMGALSGMVFGAYLQISGGEISVRALRQLAGMTFPPRIETAVQVFLMVALGLIIGAAALSFQKFMITVLDRFPGFGGSGQRVYRHHHPSPAGQPLSGRLDDGGLVVAGHAGDVHPVPHAR